MKNIKYFFILIISILLFSYKNLQPINCSIDFKPCAKINQDKDSLIFFKIKTFNLKKYKDKRTVQQLLNDLKLNYVDVIPIQEPPGIISSVSYKFGKNVYLNLKIKQYKYFTPIMDSVVRDSKYIELFKKEIVSKIKVKYKEQQFSL